MRFGTAVSIGLLLVTVGSTAVHADTEIYLNGGLAISRLSEEANALGGAIASYLASQEGGVWAADRQNRTGFQGGVGFRYTKSGLSGLAVEVGYANRGNRYKFSETTGSQRELTTTWKIDYVEIPVLFWVAPTGPETARPILMFGPVIGIKSGSNFEVETQGQSQSFEAGHEVKSTVLAGLVGTAVRIPVTQRSTFDIETRVQLGLTDALDSSSLEDVKSSNFSIMAGWSWTLGN